MREWRKVHRSLTSSERIAQVSYPARWLYTLLLVNQDDEGSYPWTATMVRSITVTTEWTVIEASTYLEELKSQGLVDQQAQRVTIRRGVEFNGNPKSNSRKPLVYPESDISPTTVGLESDISPIREEERERRERLEREETPVSSEAVSLSEQEKTIWPEWYAMLWSIPGFKRPLAECSSWLTDKGCLETAALAKAYALRDWWQTSSKSKKRIDPWLTFTNWIVKDLGANNTKPSDILDDPQHALIVQEKKEMEARATARREPV